MVLILGATSYYAVGEGRWSWFDCFYMTIITLSTVGFAETLEGMNEVPEARGVTIALIVLGSATLLYFISSLTALIVEGDLQGILRRRSMREMINPKTVAFLDRMVRFGSGISVGIEAIDIPAGSPLVGKRLAETGLREAGALVVAVHRADGDYVYNPGSEHLLEEGDSLIVLAESQDVKNLRANVVAGVVA